MYKLIAINIQDIFETLNTFYHDKPSGSSSWLTTKKESYGKNWKRLRNFCWIVENNFHVSGSDICLSYDAFDGGGSNIFCSVNLLSE